ncbi:MAG: SMI1/KNR4 family protein [Chitinophagaceae bacterium]|nr:SMI1/KNR4 family protein [Chitinophagaceae bacterium]
MNIIEIEEFLEKRGCFLKGCSSKEILKIEDFFQVKLPEKYIEFLKIMGKGAGDFLKGSSVFYNEIFELREAAVELLEDDNFKTLPETAFVFFMHQGYQFAFFNIGESDNPAIYYYYEGRNKLDFEKKERTFTDFLTAHLGFLGVG